MAENPNEKFTVYPVAGWDFARIPDGRMMLALRYADTKEEPKTQAELDRATQVLRVIMTASQADEFASAARLSAQMIEPPTGKAN